MWPLIISMLVTFLDQLTKELIRRTYVLGESHTVIPGFFDLTYLRNTGAAWGMLGGQNASLTIVSLVMLALMICFRRSFLSDTWEHRVALGLLVGGIVGNLMDRIRLGSVTDFLHFYIGRYQWPTFNLADSAICVGVGIYVISAWWVAGHPLHEARYSNKPSGDVPPDHGSAHPDG